MNKVEATQAIKDFVNYNSDEIKQLFVINGELGDAFLKALSSISSEYGSGEEIGPLNIEETEIKPETEVTPFKPGDYIVNADYNEDEWVKVISIEEKPGSFIVTGTDERKRDFKQSIPKGDIESGYYYVIPDPTQKKPATKPIVTKITGGQPVLSNWTPEWAKNIDPNTGKAYRPSVQRKASECKIDEVGMGFDGKLYEVRKNTAGVKQWKVYKRELDLTTATFLSNPEDIKVAIDQLHYAINNQYIDAEEKKELEKIISYLESKL